MAVLDIYKQISLVLTFNDPFFHFHTPFKLVNILQLWHQKLFISPVTSFLIRKENSNLDQVFFKTCINCHFGSTQHSKFILKNFVASFFFLTHCFLFQNILPFEMSSFYRFSLKNINVSHQMFPSGNKLGIKVSSASSKNSNFGETGLNDIFQFCFLHVLKRSSPLFLPRYRKVKKEQCIEISRFQSKLPDFSKFQ